MANKISVIIDVAVDKGVSALKNFRTAVTDAEGVTGKFKAGAGAAFDGVKQNIAGFAVAAAGSLATFAVKAVGEFQSVALAVGEFSQKTGVAAEDASRWVELAADLNVPLSSIEGAFNKMNLAIAAGKPALEQFDGAVVRTKTGAVDVDATFQNLVTQIGAIPDATKRAQAAQAIFGKSWGDISQLMGMSATELKGKLDAVGDAKIIDDREIEQARKFRDQVNDIKDKFEDLTIQIGGALVPVLSGVANGITAIDSAANALTGGNGGLGKLAEASWAQSAAGKASGFFTQLSQLFGDTEEDAVATEAAMAEVAAQVDIYGERIPKAAESTTAAFDAAAESANNLAITTGIVKRAAEALDAAWGNLKGEIDADQAWIDMQTTFDDLKAKGEAAMEAAKTGAEDARTKMLEYESATNSAKQKIIDLGKEIGMTPTEVKTLLTMTDNGSIDAVEARLATLTRNRTVNLDIIERGGAGYGDRFGGPRANGGPVTAGTPYLVGERGPEIVVPSRSGTVIPNHRLGGGGGVNVTINMPPGSNGQDVVRAIQDYERRNGKGWRTA